MRGIYIITNAINGKQYVGQAQNITQRWAAHKAAAHDPIKSKTAPALYAAFNKYGVDNFKFEVLEEIEDLNQDLTPREAYWIQFYHTIENGYNLVLPNEVMVGENNPNASLTEVQVNEIKDLLRNSKMEVQDIAKQYRVAFSTVYRINKGEIWAKPNEQYPVRTWNSLAHFGEKSGRSKLSDAEVIKIRQRYVNEDPSVIWQDYKDVYSLSGFSKVCRGETYKHLPIYNRTTKTWNKSL